MSHGEGARGHGAWAGTGPRRRLLRGQLSRARRGSLTAGDTAWGWASGMEAGRGRGPQELRPGLWKGFQVKQNMVTLSQGHSGTVRG